jgi:hypothetical protein
MHCVVLCIGKVCRGGSEELDYDFSIKLQLEHGQDLGVVRALARRRIEEMEEGYLSTVRFDGKVPNGCVQTADHHVHLNRISINVTNIVP